MIVLGIDPGSQVTGFGLIRVEEPSLTAGARDGLTHLTHGVISPPSSLPFHDRLAIIAREIEALIERCQPDIVVVERIFLGKNADSAFKLGHVRGVAIASALRAGCEIAEYAARSVKKGVTGSGASTKEQVQLILFAALGVKDSKMKIDASDALALAFYHARQMGIERLNGAQL